ncbi:MAG: ATP-binding protein [Blastocatellia bacterium]
MKTSTRLILLLTIAVSMVMAVASYFMLRQRALELEAAAVDEVRAHAITLRIALEEDYATQRALDAQRLINRLGENPKIKGVFLFDREGRITISSNPEASEELKYVAEARSVIETGRSIAIKRNIDREEVLSILEPIHLNNERIGALEISQPISFVNADIERARRDTLTIAGLLCAAIFLIVWLVTHFGLNRHVRELLRGALAYGRGDLAYRVNAPRGGEFFILAREFNHMADSLAAQRRAAELEAEQRLVLERSLRHSERLASVGRLAAGVAHEMGAPLQVIDGRARQLLHQHEASLDLRQRNLTIIRTQTERISRIVRQLLNLARPYNLRLEAVNLPALAHSVLEILEINAEQAGVTLACESPGELLVEADANLLHQVFVNICQNAILTMSVGGLAQKRLRIGFPAGETESAGGMITVSFADTGGGITPEHLEQLFDPFFTTREPGQGTGLGLPVSRRIVEEHGGRLVAVNNNEGGATFLVYLPRRQKQQTIVSQTVGEIV